MRRIKQALLAGILAGLMLLTGCSLFKPKEDRPVPEEYQYDAVVVFEDHAAEETAGTGGA